MMRNLFAILLLLLAPLALAGQRIAREGDDEVRIFDSPCVSMETIARIPEADRGGQWHKVTGRINKQTYFGCWRALGAYVHIIWDDGDQGLLPIEDLIPVPEA